MAKRVVLVLASMDYNGTSTSSKSLGDINRDYIGFTGVAASGAPDDQPDMQGTFLPYQNNIPYESFAAWADAVAKGLNSLTTNTYVDSQITASWTLNEELID